MPRVEFGRRDKGLYVESFALPLGEKMSIDKVMPRVKERARLR